MRQELVRYARGELVPTREDRDVARQAHGIYNRARLRALEADGHLAVAQHLMEGMTQLDNRRRALCHPDNEELNKMLCTIELNAFEKVLDIQRGQPPVKPDDPWDF